MMKAPIGSAWLVRVAGIIVVVLGAFGGLVVLAEEAPKGAPTPPAYGIKGRLVQTLRMFDDPEGAIFSEDGRFVFVSNSAEIGMPARGFTGQRRPGPSASWPSNSTVR
jgi:hypothetical protein